MCLCAHLCVHPNVETLTDCTRASLLFFPCLHCFVPTLCAGSQSSASINLLFFFFPACEYTNLHLCFLFSSGEFASASQCKCICYEVVDGEAREQKRQRREKNRTGRSRREGRGGRWQVDYGRRSRCLETAGTRDARLLGDQHDAMTSAV